MPSNIDSVIDDVGDVKDDITNESRKKVGLEMQNMAGDIRQTIANDPLYTGALYDSVEIDTPLPNTVDMQFTVRAGGPRAAHGTVVEFGSGDKSERPFSASEKVPPQWSFSSTSEYPRQFPYSAPNISPDALAVEIKQWMERKGIVPQKDTLSASASAIASTIVNDGTYAHPFMRPAYYRHELQLIRAARNAIRSATR